LLPETTMARPVDPAEVALANLSPERRAKLEALFSVYDQDNDGNLTLYETSGVLHKLGHSPSVPGTSFFSPSSPSS